jgi:hypothetical protein
MTKKKKTRQRGLRSPKPTPARKNYLDRIDTFFGRHLRTIFVLSVVFTCLVAMLLFQFRVSIGGDDSAYILRAFRFIRSFDFPTYQGAFYPIVLGVFMLPVGLNVTYLKFLSFIFILVHLFFFYKAWKGNVGNTVLSVTLLVISINAYLLYYASQTYSEAFFLMLQAYFFYFFFSNIIKKESPGAFDYLVVALLVFLLANTRTVAYSVLVAVVAYLLVNKKWVPTAITLLGFFAFFFLLKFVKAQVFDISDLQFQSQLNSLLAVDPYDAGKGQETFSGFFGRFVENSKLYLSKHYLHFLGFRRNLATTSGFLTLLLYVLFLVSFVLSARKNKFLLFTGLYLACMIGTTFVSLQTRWDQDRLIIVFFPLISLFLLAGIYQLSRVKKLRTLQYLVLPMVGVVFLLSFGITATRIKGNGQLLMAGLRGDDYYGMQPDWVNYIKMSRWAAENVPKDMNIGSRKPSISFIYSGKEFIGLYRVPSDNADSLLANLKSRKIDYVMMASLRTIPERKTQYTISTINRILYPIQEKYPQKLTLVHQIGVDEKAYLFKINYDD